MKNHPIEIAAVAVVAIAEALLPLVVAVVALLLLVAGYRPARQSQPRPKPAAAAKAAPRVLDGLAVRELRQLAREAGHRALARSGRRAELLAALS